MADITKLTIAQTLDCLKLRLILSQWKIIVT